MFMMVCVFVCLFICEDFRSGFAKNLFTVRAQKGDYVVSKILCGFSAVHGCSLPILQVPCWAVPSPVCPLTWAR
jgi:hypothetical protein